MILIINVCDNVMHYYEFVKPIENILKDKHEFLTVHYSKLSKEVVEDKKIKKILICGTSLRDFEYSKHLDKFSFIKTTDKPVLGICAGMQIICQTFGCGLIKTCEIGLIKINVHDLFGFNGEKQVYALHNMAVIDSEGEFDIIGKTNDQDGIIQAIKLKNKNIFGVLFHPEVRNKQIIEKFLIH